MAVYSSTSNFPLLCSAVQEMITIMQEYGEVVCCVGSSFNVNNTDIFSQADIRLAISTYTYLYILQIRRFLVWIGPYSILRVHSFWPIWKLDQIADQREQKIRKRICFHTEVPGSRLPWDFWSVVHVIKQSRMRSINRLIKWNEQSKTSLGYQSERSASWSGSFGLQSKIGYWGEMEWKI